MENAASRTQPYIEATLQNGTAEELQELFGEVHPADLAEALEDLDDDRLNEVLKAMPAEIFGQLIEQMPAIDALDHLNKSSREYRKEALSHLADDDLVDLLQEVPEEEREDFVGMLPEAVKARSRRLLAYPESSAGGRMTTEITTLHEDMTIREAIETLQVVKETTELLSRIYVVDDRGRLAGKVRLRDLTFNPRDKLIKEIMDGDLLAVDAYADQEEAARMLLRYDLMAVPVVNADRQVLGVITHDDAMEILEEENTEDIEKISGIQGPAPDETYLRTGVLSHFRRRVGWVVTMAFMGILSGSVLYHFEDFINVVPVLALYITMVVASGGNTGSQSATMVIRAMSLGEADTKDFLEVVWKEMRIGLMIGSLVGLCMFLQIKFIPVGTMPEDISAIRIALVVGLALMVQITTSTVLGASLPHLARLMRADPAAVASPVISTVVDMTGLLIYFSLAKALLGL